MTAFPPPGTVAEPFQLPVERGKVREFARATHARSAAFFDDPAATVPPTFLTTAAFWADAAGSLLATASASPSRLLHGAQEFVFHGPPPRVGDTLTARQRIDQTYTKQGRRGGEMTFVVLLTEFRAADGRLVAEDKHTTIETGRSLTPATTPEAPTAPAGEPLPTYAAGPLTITDIVRYQGASGDLVPLHHDDAFARAAGYPGVFSVGMLHAGILGSYVADLYGAQHVRRFAVRFREQAWPGDELSYGGHVVRRQETAAGDETVLDLFVRRQTGGTHLTATATVLTPT